MGSWYFSSDAFTATKSGASAGADTAWPACLGAASLGAACAWDVVGMAVLHASATRSSGSMLRRMVPPGVGRGGATIRTTDDGVKSHDAPAHTRQARLR